MWVDGYWQGSKQDGYPSCYFNDGKMEYPWQKNSVGVIKDEASMAERSNATNSKFVKVAGSNPVRCAT